MFVNILKENRGYYGFEIFNWINYQINNNTCFINEAKDILNNFKLTSDNLYFVKKEISNGKLKIHISKALTINRNCLTCKYHYTRMDDFSDEGIGDIFVFCSESSYIGDFEDAGKDICEKWRKE